MMLGPEGLGGPSPREAEKRDGQVARASDAQRLAEDAELQRVGGLGLRPHGEVERRHGLAAKEEGARAFDLKRVDDAVVLEGADGPTHVDVGLNGPADGPTHVDVGLNGPADAEHGAAHLPCDALQPALSQRGGERFRPERSVHGAAAPGVEHSEAGLVDVGLVGDHAGHEGMGGVVREVAAVVVDVVVAVSVGGLVVQQVVVNPHGGTVRQVMRATAPVR